MSRGTLLALGLGGLYAASRFTGLTTLPIFLDETQHIHWSVEIAEGERWMRPWNYGKGVSVFVNALLFPWAFDHYLWASRALAVGFGAVTLLAGLAAARRLLDERAALVFGILYLACPYALFYDRLALTDPPMATFATLALLLSLRLLETPRRGLALLLALALVLAVLSKATAILVVLIPALALLVLGPLERRRGGAFASAVGVAALALAWPLHRFFATTATVRLGVGHRDEDLATRLSTNLPLAASWLSTYLTLPIVLLALLGLGLGVLHRSRPAFFLSGLVVLPVLGFAAISTLWFPRYLVLVTVPVLLLAAHGFLLATALLPSAGRVVLLALALLPAFHLDRDILFSPALAALPEIDREQFVLGWPSGYGTEGTIGFVREELRHRPDGLTVVTHVHARRTTWRALGLEFAHEPRVDLRDLDLSRAENLDLLAAWAHARPTLVVLSPVGPARRAPDRMTFAPLGRLAFRSCKPDGGNCDEVWRLFAPPLPARSGP